MKKTYIIPTSEEIKINAETIFLAGSVKPQIEELEAETGDLQETGGDALAKELGDEMEWDW